jgi:hypothetical protein
LTWMKILIRQQLSRLLPLNRGVSAAGSGWLCRRWRREGGAVDSGEPLSCAPALCYKRPSENNSDDSDWLSYALMHI